MSELRLAQAKTMEEANKVLADYLPKFNRDFQVTPLESGLAYRKIGNNFILDRYFCNKYERVVGGDNVVRFNSRRLQIMPLNERASYAHARVEVHEKLDGSLAVCYQGTYLRIRSAPAEAQLQRTKVPDVKTLDAVKRKTAIPALNHPWRTVSEKLIKSLG